MSQGCMEVSQSVWRVYVGEPELYGGEPGVYGGCMEVYGGEPECMEGVWR